MPLTPRQILESAKGETFFDDRGKPFQLEFDEGLTEEEISDYEKFYGFPLPEEIKEMLRFTVGFSSKAQVHASFEMNLDFLCHIFPAIDIPFILPHHRPVKWDVLHGYWTVQINPETGDWGRVFYTVPFSQLFQAQSPDISSFLENLLNTGRPNQKSDLQRMLGYEGSGPLLFESDGYHLSEEQIANSGDSVLIEFAASLPEGYGVIDMRSPEGFTGFYWGQNKKRTLPIRHETELLFGVEKYQPSRLELFFESMWGKITGKK